MAMDYFRKKQLDNIKNSTQPIRDQVLLSEKKIYATNFANELKNVKILSRLYAEGKDAKLFIEEPSVFFQKAFDLNGEKYPSIGDKKVSFYDKNNVPRYEIGFSVIADKLPPDKEMIEEKGVLAGLKFVVRKNEKAQFNDDEKESKEDLVALGKFYKKVFLDSKSDFLKNSQEKIVKREQLLNSLKHYKSTMVQNPNENCLSISGSFADRLHGFRQEASQKLRQENNFTKRQGAGIFQQSL